MKNIKKYVISCIAVVFLILALIFAYVKISPFENETANALINASISRICGGVASLFAIILLGDSHLFKIKKTGLLHNILWCIPCGLVVLANFPFSSLIRGIAVIEHVQLIPLL